MESPPGPGTLLRRLLGAECISFSPCGDRVDRCAGRIHVVVERGLDPEALCVRLGHLLAYASYLARDEVAGEADVEDLAGALVMPSVAVQACIRSVGRRVDEVALAFVVPQSFARKRLRALGIALESGQFDSVRLLRTAG